MSKYDQALPEGSTTLILVEFYSIPRRRISCQPSARRKFVFSISLSSRFGLCNLCVYLDWRICRTITRDIPTIREDQFFFTRGWSYTGMGIERHWGRGLGERVHFKKWCTNFKNKFIGRALERYKRRRRDFSFPVTDFRVLLPIAHHNCCVAQEWYGVDAHVFRSNRFNNFF